MRFHIDSQEHFEQIQYFLESTEEQHISIQANILMFSVIEKVGPVECFYYRVTQTKNEKLVRIEKLQKVLHLKTSESGNSYVVKLVDVLEHS